MVFSDSYSCLPWISSFQGHSEQSGKGLWGQIKRLSVGLGPIPSAPFGCHPFDRWSWHGNSGLLANCGQLWRGLFTHFGKEHPNKSTLFGRFSSQSSFLESKWCQTYLISLSDRMKEHTDKEAEIDAISQGCRRALSSAQCNILISRARWQGRSRARPRARSSGAWCPTCLRPRESGVSPSSAPRPKWDVSKSAETPGLLSLTTWWSWWASSRA